MTIPQGQYKAQMDIIEKTSVTLDKTLNNIKTNYFDKEHIAQRVGTLIKDNGVFTIEFLKNKEQLLAEKATLINQRDIINKAAKDVEAYKKAYTIFKGINVFFSKLFGILGKAEKDVKKLDKMIKEFDKLGIKEAVIKPPVTAKPQVNDPAKTASTTALVNAEKIATEAEQGAKDTVEESHKQATQAQQQASEGLNAFKQAQKNPVSNQTLGQDARNAGQEASKAANKAAEAEQGAKDTVEESHKQATQAEKQALERLDAFKQAQKNPVSNQTLEQDARNAGQEASKAANEAAEKTNQGLASLFKKTEPLKQEAPVINAVRKEDTPPQDSNLLPSAAREKQPLLILRPSKAQETEDARKNSPLQTTPIDEIPLGTNHVKDEARGSQVDVPRGSPSGYDELKPMQLFINRNFHKSSFEELIKEESDHLLFGFDKDDVEKLKAKINTLEISIRLHEGVLHNAKYSYGLDSEVTQAHQKNLIDLQKQCDKAKTNLAEAEKDVKSFQTAPPLEMMDLSPTNTSSSDTDKKAVSPPPVKKAVPSNAAGMTTLQTVFQFFKGVR